LFPSIVFYKPCVQNNSDCFEGFFLVREKNRPNFLFGGLGILFDLVFFDLDETGRNDFLENIQKFRNSSLIDN